MFSFALGYLFFSRNERGTLLDTLTSLVTKLTPKLILSIRLHCFLLRIKNRDMNMSGIKNCINYEIKDFFVKLTQTKEEAYLIRQRTVRPLLINI